MTPSRIPTLSPTFRPSAAPTTKKPTTSRPSVVPSVVPTVCPSAAPSAIIGVTAEDIQIDSAVLIALIKTVKECLVSDPTMRSYFNVTIDAVADVNRRLTSLRGKNTQDDSKAQVKYSVTFDVDKQQYLNAATGYTQMTTSFSDSLVSGFFTATLQENLGRDSTLSEATAATTAVYSQPMSPTLSIIPPKITLQVTSTAINSLTLAVTFDIPTVYAGYVYCAALPQGTVITDVTQVILAGQTTFYLAGSTSVSVIVKGLAAVTNYDLYSYVQSTAGYGSSVSDIQGTKKTVTTACCKTIQFTNAPGSVYGDVFRKYTSASLASTYIYSYSLSAAPRSTVTVTPIFKNLDHSPFTQLTVVPASKTFTNSTSTLQGSFYISAASSLSGQFYVTMNTTSTNALDYSSSTALFTILSSQAPIPAPKLFMAQFSDAVNYMYIVFDSATDKGLMTANAWPCNNAFIFNGANTTSCAWLNSTFIKATFA
eukprot:gene47487-biopygen34267